MDKIKIFVSHTHADETAAAAFVDYLLSFAQIPPSQIRCTSVPGFAHAIGTTTSSQLRQDLQDCDIVVGLLSKEARNKSYVMMEIGAAWGLGKRAMVLLGSKVEPGSMGPLSEIRMVKASQIDSFRYEITGFMSQLASQVGAQINAPDRCERAKELFLKSWSKTSFTQKPWFSDDDDDS